ncbi:MAG: DUF3887 domain-containing protein [Lachnospiraceae bacterium]|nr:DUF3887 domain-containing protein [Lachnospiraceae bacterium]
MSEKYVRQIVKKLKCSKSKRAEIQKQLMSDIMIKMEDGMSIENIIEDMGNPKEIATEFNDSFSDAERKTYRKEKWRKRLIIIGVVLFILAFLIYWFLPKSTDLENSKIFDKEKVQEKAELVVQLLDEEDYDSLKKESSEKMQSMLSKSFIDKAKSNFGTDWGAFQRFGNIYLVEVNQFGKRNAVVQVNASYENASVTYTITFDKNMKLSGLWMK